MASPHYAPYSVKLVGPLMSHSEPQILNWNAQPQTLALSRGRLQLWGADPKYKH